MNAAVYTCNFCRRLGDTYCTPSFPRMVEHYKVTHNTSPGRVYAMFGKAKP